MYENMYQSYKIGWVKKRDEVRCVACMYVKVVLGEFLLLSRISKVHAHKYFMEQFSSLQLTTEGFSPVSIELCSLFHENRF